MEEERKEEESNDKNLQKNDIFAQNQQIVDEIQIDNNQNQSNSKTMQEDNQQDKAQEDEKNIKNDENDGQEQEYSPSRETNNERVQGILQKTIKKVEKYKDSPEKKLLKIAQKTQQSQSPQQQQGYSLLEEIQMRLDQKQQLQAERQQQHYQHGLTGGGVLLWQWYKLTDKEIEVKKSKLLEAGKIKELSEIDTFQTQGYSILLLGQIEKKGKFKGHMLYTDPGGKVEPKETASVVAARELFEETAGLFEIPDRHFDFKTSFRMGGSYILFNILISCEEKDDLPEDFRFNMDVLRKATKEAPKTFLESSNLARIFVDELNHHDLFNATQILDILTAQGETIQIGRRTIAILKSLVRSPNVFDFKKSEILIKDTLNLQRNNTTKDSPLVKVFPWVENTIIYQEREDCELEKEGERKEEIENKKEKSEDDEVKGVEEGQQVQME